MPPKPVCLSYSELDPKRRVLEVMRCRFHGATGLSHKSEKFAALRITELSAEDFVRYADELVSEGLLRCEMKAEAGKQTRVYFVAK